MYAHTLTHTRTQTHIRTHTHVCTEHASMYTCTHMHTHTERLLVFENNNPKLSVIKVSCQWYHGNSWAMLWCLIRQKLTILHQSMISHTTTATCSNMKCGHISVQVWDTIPPACWFSNRYAVPDRMYAPPPKFPALFRTNVEFFSCTWFIVSNLLPKRSERPTPPPALEAAFSRKVQLMTE